jgi:AIPR protein
MAVETLKLKARDELIRVTEKELETKFGTMNVKQQSVAATKFYLREIRNPVSTAIAEEDVAFGIVDGANDLGCDFIYRDDGHVLIVQSKYRTPSSTESNSDISHFKSILKRFRDPNHKPNKPLQDAISEIDWEADTFELVYVCFSRLGDQALVIAEQQADYPSDVPEIEDRCDWRFLDESELNVALRSARNFQSGVSEKPYTLYPLGDKGQRGAASVISVDAGQHRSYVMTLDANQLVNAYKALGRDAIFSLNIRNFIGNTSTNKEIIRSAQTAPENFYLFNNGISCLATGVTVSEKSVLVTGFQVINGAQTVKALVHVDKSKKWAAQIPCVLVRVTEIKEGYGPGGKIREQITRFNNTQNTIKISDFRSNDPVQVALKEQFAAIPRRGRKVAYLPKRTDRVPPQTEIVRLEEFAKSVYAFLFDPTEFTGSTSFLFDDSKAGGYTKVFGDETHVWERMPDDEFELRAAIYWIAQDFGAHLRVAREAEKDADARASLERKWLLIFATATTFRYYYPGDEFKNQLRKLHKGDWSLASGMIDKRSQILTRVFQSAKSGVTTAYKNSKKTNPNFEHRKWIRSKDTPNDIRDVLHDIVLPIQPHIDEIPK